MPRAVIVLLVASAILFSNIFATEIVCNRPNEEYQCGSACQTTCSNLGQPCPIVNIRCNDACYCIEGYARISDDDSPCIPQSECPKNCKRMN